MQLTIRDVAKAAGVSTATVSNVLNKRGKVGRRTRSLVLSTVRRLSYHPNLHARRLASRDTHMLGIIVSDIENPFFPEIIKGFLARTREKRVFNVRDNDAEHMRIARGQATGME